MKRCECCSLDINTLSNRCPICSSKLEGTGKDAIIPRTKRSKLPIVMKLILFVSIASCIICSYVNYIINGDFTWSTYVILGVFSNYLILYLIFKSRRDTLKLLIKYGFIVVLLLFIWFYFTKVYLLTNIIIPSFCIFELLLADVVACIIRKNHIRKYLKIIVSNILVSFIPLLLKIFNFTTYDLLIHVSIMVSIINLLGLIIFDFDDLKNELKKIFNY